MSDENNINKKNLNFDADEEMFRFINEHSLNVRKEEERRKTLEREAHRKRVAKKSYKKRLQNLLVTALVGGMAITGGYLGIEHATNELKLYDANKYMGQAIDFVATDLDRGVLSDGSVMLFEQDGESLKKIVEDLGNKFGLSRDCAIYCISQKYGDKGFDEVVKQYGYENKDQFLNDLYFDSYNRSDSGNTIYSKKGSYKVFENNIQNELVNKSNEIQHEMDLKSLDSRGKKK